jgi:hypothetical protein
MATLVDHCLDKNPEVRFQSMRDVRSALSALSHVSHHRVNRARFRPRDSVLDIKVMTDRIGLENIPRSRRALTDLAHAVQGNISQDTREAVMNALSEFLHMNADRDGNVISPSIRDLRKMALDLISSMTQGRLSMCFRDRDLSDLDLYDMNFARNQLSGFRFKHCFLVEVDFSGSDLTQSVFLGAHVRNANFAGANLSGVDWTGADWFNALGFTQTQLESVRRESLLECPATVQAMFRYLANHYVLPFESWSATVQQQLQAAWLEYLRPGGLREITAGWQR